ncbi:MAG: hypothetical protein WA799_08210 [Nitrosotalea sp.]
MPIKTREIRYKEPEENEEWAIVRYTCPKCNTVNYPHGNKMIRLPFTEITTCSSCRLQKPNTWLDAKGRRELARKRAGLTIESGVDVEKEKLKKQLLETKKRLARYEGSDKPQDVFYSDAEEE